MLSMDQSLAPHTGHVSNFRSPNRTVIEPVDGPCFQSDPCELLAGVHGGHPVRTRLELAKGPRNFRMRRHPAANRADSPTLRDLSLLLILTSAGPSPSDRRTALRSLGVAPHPLVVRRS